MQVQYTNIRFESDSHRIDYMQFDSSDGKKWKKVFDSWMNLKMAMRDYQAREPNFPEGLSEVAFCLWSGSVRKIQFSGPHGSFDTVNLKARRREQVKACSVQFDLTSFGPTSVWDDLYFMDFWRDGIVDGRFDVYKIPNELIYGHQINSRQSFSDQQAEGKRPRLCIKKEIIVKKRISPLETAVEVW